MKTLIVYSTISGNTKAVCERIYEALNTEKEIVNVKDIKNLEVDNYANFIIGFWCDKGTMDKDSIDFLFTPSFDTRFIKSVKFIYSPFCILSFTTIFAEAPTFFTLPKSKTNNFLTFFYREFYKTFINARF